MHIHTYTKNPLRNAARNALEKRRAKERNKMLAGSTLGGNGLNKCPERLPIEFTSCLIFRTCSKCSP